MGDKQKTPVVALALITAVCLLGDSMLYVVLPTHWKEIGLTSLVEVGVLLSVNRFVRLPLNPLVGLLYRKIHIRNGILIAVFLAAVTTVGYGHVQGFWWWILLRSTWGLSWSLLKLGAYVLIVQLSTDCNRGQYMGTYNGLYRIGSLLGMLVGGLLADLYGTRIITSVFGVIALVTIPFVFRYLSNSNLKPDGAEIKSVRIDVSIVNGALLWTFATVFLAAMSFEGMFTATLSHLIDSQLSAVEVAGTVLGAATIAGILQAVRYGMGPWLSPWIGKVSDGKAGRKRILVIMLGSATILLALVPIKMVTIVWLLIVFTALLISTMLTTVVDALVSDDAARSSKIAIMTMYTIVLDVGAALGPVYGYSVEKVVGMSGVFWIASAIMGLLTLRWWYVFNSENNLRLTKVEERTL